MSWLYSRVLVEDYSQAISSDTTLYALSNEMSSVSMFWCRGKTIEFYNRSRYGMTFALLMDDRGKELWTWFLEDSLVKRSLLQQEEEILLKKDLWGEMRRVIREVRPHLVFAENVSEKAILQAQNDLLQDGYNSKYLKLSAKDLGADHEWDRFWLLAYTDYYCQLRSTKYAEAQELPKLRNGVWETFSGELRVSNGGGLQDGQT